MTDSDSTRNLGSVRRTLKGKLTRLQNYLENISQQENVSVNELVARREAAESCAYEFDRVQQQLEDSNAAEIESNERDSFEARYFSLKGKLSDLIDAARGTSSNYSASPTTSYAPEPIRVKLPTINLPTFSGTCEDWPTFRETFDSLIDRDVTLTDVQKFHYLLSSLSGEAKDKLASLEITGGNYHNAKTILTTRYENKKLLVSKHVQGILDIPTVTKDSHASLQHLIDTSQKHLRSLRTLNADNLDTVLIHFLRSKLDKDTQRSWENVSTDHSTFTEFIEHLESRGRTMENCQTWNNSPSAKQTTTHNKQARRTTFINTSPELTIKKHEACIMCKQAHSIYSCPNFLKLSPKERLTLIRNRKACINCLRTGHLVLQCRAGKCRRCELKHHTLLHLDSSPQATGESKEATSKVTACSLNKSTSEVILATAVVLIQDSVGRYFPCRALLDSASQSNLICDQLACSLGLKRHKNKLSIVGIGSESTHSAHAVSTHIKSRHNKYGVSLTFNVLKQITDNLPHSTIDSTDWTIPKNIHLADDKFNIPYKIDILIGGQIFWKLIRNGQMSLPNNITLQNTRLGWVVSGAVNQSYSKTKALCHIARTNSQGALEESISKFWNLEEINLTKRSWTSEEAQCERQFIHTVKRNHEGRFIVKLPFKDDSEKLGDSYSTALSRFKSTERRLGKNNGLKEEYLAFLNDYYEQGHMHEIDALPDNTAFYLPHHPVIKETSLTTKTRIVFDGSAPTTSNYSLNDLQAVGPIVQRDLLSIMVNFRMYRYVFSADIQQMFRQILVHPSHHRFQRILWRNSPEEQIQTFALQTVTYGLASSPFLATRCLNQLAIEGEQTHPLASRTILRSFYVDDLLGGSNTLQEAHQTQTELIQLLGTAGFHLRKWCSNHDSLLDNIQPDSTNQYLLINSLTDDDTTKALGMRWNPKDDTFHFEPTTTRKGIQTKRTILSKIATLFDPLGLLGPIIVKAKLIMKELWKLKIDWDAEVPEHLLTAWETYVKELDGITGLHIPRRTPSGEAICSLQIHGFCDASESAYGGCIYTRSTDSYGAVRVNLLCSKNRVAPVKNISLPRLELCGALLLAQLYDKVKEAIDDQSIERVILWSDSTNTLSWLSKPSNTWKTFVANRVSEVQALTPNCSWRHVRGTENPADVLSRGSYPSALIKSPTWLHGPAWLAEDEKHWPISDMPNKPTNLELRNKEVCFIATTDKLILFERYSSLNKLLRVTAYCLRFTNNCKHDSPHRQTGPLTVSELTYALNTLLKIVQREQFHTELNCLGKGTDLLGSSPLKTLTPFLDDKGLIRVGGRLQQSQIQGKHPIVLPSQHKLTELVITDTHINSLHAGPQTLLAHVRSRFWPLRGKQLCNQVVRTCVRCTKARPRAIHPLMGILPAVRVQPARPFINVGVDYCGPLLARPCARRKLAPMKVYICLFICMATKAIHLELVSDLTTAGFIAALKRFIGRRGKCLHIYSDNATTFVGCRRELAELSALFLSEQHTRRVSEFLARDNVTFHCIPPRSPHFGGLWEAGVKGIKHHLKRAIGATSLTFEELNTLIVQIEACVNSRPICPLSNDPNDLNPLTPAHFLIGDSMLANLEPDLVELSLSRLSRWQRVQQALQLFWKRWSLEYLTGLQQRTKWYKDPPNIPIGSLVLLKEDHRPPQQWDIARIEALHKGNDGRYRVATIKTNKGTFKRAIVKLCPLPVETQNDSEQTDTVPGKTTVFQQDSDQVQ